MVPVRKPGRPLSTCPCPPGRPCSCGGVRVAIPKKQKCACPGEAAGDDEVHEEKQSPVEPPTSPSRPSFRVGKPNGSSKVGSRKQSFDPANLERMDPRSVNLIPAPTSNGVANGMAVAGSAGLQSSQSDLAGFSLGLGMMPPGPGSTYNPTQNTGFGSPMPYNIGFQYTQPNPLQHGIKLENGGLYSTSNDSFGTGMPPPPFANGNHTSHPINSPAQPTIQIPKVNGTASGGGSCCGTKAQKPQPAPTNPPVSQQGYEQSYLPQPSKGGSCCGSKAQKPAPVPASANAPTPHQVFGQAYMPQFSYPTIFRYPGDYGSWQHPIDPIIWQQVASQTNLTLSTPISPTPNGDVGEVGTSHQCNCGEGCQCVGCLAHPFNAQMFQYVNNAYNGSNGSNGSSPGGTDAGGVGVAQTAAAGQESPAEAPTPAASEGSPPREEQSLSTLDYFFVNLPISGLCGGNLESCPCGDSCDCPGCLVHNVPLTQG